MGLVRTLAGRPDAMGMDDGPCSTARFAGPEGMALDASGATLYVIDAWPVNLFFAVRAVDLRACVVRTLVTDRGKSVGSVLADGQASTATLGDIWSAAVSPDGLFLYIMSYTYACVRAVSIATGYVSTYSGKCSLTSAGDAEGGVLDARYNIPENLLEVCLCLCEHVSTRWGMHLCFDACGLRVRYVGQIDLCFDACGFGVRYLGQIDM